MAQDASGNDPTVPPVSPKQTAAVADTAQVLIAAKSETAAATTSEATVTSENIVNADMASKDCQQLLLPPPTENLKCWNCDQFMTPEHQCGEPSPGSSSGSLIKDSTQSVKAASSPSSTPPGSPARTMGRRIFPKKFVCDDS